MTTPTNRPTHLRAYKRMLEQRKADPARATRSWAKTETSEQTLERFRAEAREEVVRLLARPPEEIMLDPLPEPSTITHAGMVLDQTKIDALPKFVRDRLPFVGGSPAIIRSIAEKYSIPVEDVTIKALEDPYEPYRTYMPEPVPVPDWREDVLAQPGMRAFLNHELVIPPPPLTGKAKAKAQKRAKKKLKKMGIKVSKKGKK